MTRFVTAGAILVLAIVFGFIFWNQFSSNQQQLSGSNQNQMASQTAQNGSSGQAAVPKNDNLDSIDAVLSGSNITSIDSDSTQMNSQIKSY